MKIKDLLKRNFISLAFFYRYLKGKLLILLIISVFVGLLDGFGLAMFVPLLELVSDPGNEVSTDSLGNLSFLVKGLEFLGFQLNLITILLVIAVFFTLKGFAKWLEGYLSVAYKQFLLKKIREELVFGFSNYKYSRFTNMKGGVIQNSLTAEVAVLAQSYTAYSFMIQQLVMVVTYLVLALLANPFFAILVMIGGGITNLLFRFFYTKTKNYSKKLVELNHKYHGLINQFVAHFKYLKATGTTSKYQKHVFKEIENIEDTNRQIGEIDSLTVGIREPLMIYILIAAIAVQTYWLGGDLGSVIVSLLLLYRGLSAVVLVQSSYNKYLSFHGATANFDNIKKEFFDNRIKDEGQSISRLTGDLKLLNINFNYGTKSILEDFNLTIPEKSTIAIIGESGTGKTTLMNIMVGLLEPDSGEIFIGSHELRTLNIGDFQKRIGYITQEPIIFEDTVFNNVTLWDEQSDENLLRFWKALEEASMISTVKGFDNMEQQLLGNMGINLSGGQRQRLSIARELYKDVDILFLDEATSSLDGETERDIQKTIENLRGKLMIVIITHRDNSLVNMDEIVRLKKELTNQDIN